MTATSRSRRIRGRSAAAVWLCLGLAALTPLAVPAQEASIRTAEGPYYAGLPIDLQIVAEGFTESPEPQVEVSQPRGASLRLIRMSPSVSTQITVINGQTTQWRRVRFIYHYRLLAESPGRIVAGPFRIHQGAAEARTREVAFQIQALPTTDEQRFRLLLGSGEHFVGERIPIALEWWVSEAAAERLVGQRRARVPLFDRVEAFQFEEVPAPGAPNSIVVDTAAGPLELRSAVRRDTWKGKPYLVLSAARIMIPLKAGEFTVAPSSLVTQEGVRWRRNIFGDRSPVQVRRLQVADVPRTLSILAPPSRGRPASFSGAVGTGFSIEVAADRTVVQVGDPIRLTVSVRGDAALATLSLPPLAASGLDRRLFRTPADAASGQVDGNVKRFEVTVRVLDDSVKEIPPIEIAWFDPVQRRYQSARSRPVALSVRSAKVVSAADVVRPESAAPVAPNGQSRIGTEPRHRRASISSLGLADLTIETRTQRLLGTTAPWVSGWPAQLGAYLAGIALVLGAWWWRRSSEQDQELARRRKTLEHERRLLARTSSAADLAVSLRRLRGQLRAELTENARRDLDAVLARCDEVTFAPGADTGAIDPDLRATSLAVADALMRRAR